MNIAEIVKSFFRRGAVEIIDPRRQGIDPLAAYEGDWPRALTPTKTDPNADDNIALPLVALIVDTSVAHELGDGVSFEVVAADGTGEEGAAQAYLDQFAAATKMQAKLRKVAYHGALFGHRFIKLVIGPDGRPAGVSVIPTSSVTVATDPRDSDRVLAYTVAWTVEDARGRDEEHQEVTRRLDDGTWDITEWMRASNANAWKQVGEDVRWPYKQPPIYDAQNLTNPTAYTGRPDVTRAAIRQNQSINVQLSLLSRLLRNHANPKTIVTGLTGRQEVSWLADGAVSLPEGVTVDQLEMTAAGAAACLETVKHLEAELHKTTRTPEVASGKLESVGPISGAALSILYKPLDDKTSEKRAHTGEMLSALCADVLRYAGLGDWTVRVIWPDTTPRSVLEQRQVAVLDHQLGASTESILTDLGYDAAVEAERAAEERTASTDSILTALNRG